MRYWALRMLLDTGSGFQSEGARNVIASVPPGAGMSPPAMDGWPVGRFPCAPAGAGAGLLIGGWPGGSAPLGVPPPLLVAALVPSLLRNSRSAWTSSERLGWAAVLFCGCGRA